MGFFSIFTDPFMNRRRVAMFSVIAVVIWLLTILLLLEDSKPAHTRVILVVIDGLRADALSVENLPYLPSFRYLINTGASTINARTDVHNTLALPNNVSILTGRPVYPSDVGHRYIASGYAGKPLHDIQEKYVYS